MSKYPKKHQFITPTEMNKLLAYVKKYYMPVFRKKSDVEPFKWNAFIEDMRTTFKVTLRIGNKKISYVTRKDTEEIIQAITGVSSYKILRQYCEVPIIENASTIGSAIPLLYYNPKYNGTRQQAYCYDLNSAYSDAMTGSMPDTSHVAGRMRIVQKGEIGFIEYDSQSEDVPMPKNDLIMVGEGHHADIIFKEIESPFIRFVDVWYGKKNEYKRKHDKVNWVKAKGVLNYCIGYMQLKNPYIRATIVTRCNDRIRRLMDKDTLYCNTDSIVSRVPRNDLTIGSGLGEWKLEHIGMFAYREFNYQWDNEIPTYRGVPKAWFKKGWDLLKDPLPEPHNIYELDKENLTLRRIDYETEKTTL